MQKSTKQLTLAERDQKVVWHPFTQMKTAGPSIPIVRGKGTLLYDEAGNEYIDAIASWWMNSHGHSHPHIAARMNKQALTLEHVIFANFTHEPAVELAERLLEKLPENQARVFYSDNGSTSVEVGLKMCFQYWHNLGKQKTRIIAFEGAYHGDTFGAMSVGGRSAFSAPFAPFLFDVEFIPAPTPGLEAESLRQLTEKVADGNVAGFVFEPLVQGAAGMKMQKPEALEALVKVCKENHVLCIADEVMVGFGRTGKFFATDHIAYPPDIFCLSKGLTGGTVALGATTCSNEVFQAFYSDDKMKTLFHGHSCTANPLSCAAALASMDIFDKSETWDNIRRITTQHSAYGRKIQDHPLVENLRQCGVILAFDLRNSGETSYFNKQRDKIWNFFISRHVILRPLGNTIYVLPPYCITDGELQRVYKVIDELLNDLNGDL